MIRVAILAFDGVVADTFPMRAYALAEAISAECVPVTAADVLPYLPGRSLREAAIEAMHRVPVLQPPRFRDDVTLHDLVALRAQRSWSAAAAQGVPLQPGVMAAVPLQLARGRRLVLRSDSQRREVELLLQLAGLEDSVLFVRCADDAPRVMGATSLEGGARVESSPGTGEAGASRRRRGDQYTACATSSSMAASSSAARLRARARAG